MIILFYSFMNFQMKVYLWKKKKLNEWPKSIGLRNIFTKI